MANFSISPNMQLVIPTPTINPGPDWANNLNASLVLIDSHNHTSLQGVQIPTAGLNINSDLSLNGFNLVSTNSVRFNNLTTPLAGPLDLGAIYENLGNLWYNNATGGQVQITAGNSIVGTAGSITGLPSTPPGAAVNYINSQGTFQFLQQTPSGAGANIDVASIILRYPGSYPTPSGNFILIEAPSTLNTQLVFTWLGVIPQTAIGSTVMILENNGQIATATYDSVGELMGPPGANSIGQEMTSVGADAIAQSMTATGTTAIANTMGSTGANIIAKNRTRNSGSPAEALPGGIPVSASASFTVTTGVNVYTPVPNLNISLVTSGRPIFVGMQPDGNATPGFTNGAFITGGGGSSTPGQIRIRNVTNGDIKQFSIDTFGTIYSPSAFSGIFQAAPGSYNFIVEVWSSVASISVLKSVLIAYEL